MAAPPRPTPRPVAAALLVELDFGSGEEVFDGEEVLEAGEAVPV